MDYASEQSLAQISEFRSLGRALHAEGRLAILEGRYGDAADSYLDLVRLSHCIDRGGLLVDWLVARAIEGKGLYGIISIRTNLDENRSDALARDLGILEKNRQPYEEAKKRDIVWEETAYGWRGRLYQLLQTLCESSDSSSYKFSELRNQTTSRLTILELALQTYQSRHGSLPDRLDQLIPSGDWVTKDPFAADDATNFVYVRTKNGYVLYSVGSDGDDDGGRTAEDFVWQQDGDLTLDSLFQEDNPSNDADEPAEIAE